MRATNIVQQPKPVPELYNETEFHGWVWQSYWSIWARQFRYPVRPVSKDISVIRSGGL